MTIRVILKVTGNGIALVKKERVEMISLPGSAIPPDKQITGCWLEVLDSKGNLLYSKAIYDYFQNSAEVFDQSGNSAFHNLESDSVETYVSILIPEYKDGDLLFLYRGSALQGTYSRETLCSLKLKNPENGTV